MIMGAIRGSPHDKLGKEIVAKYRILDPTSYIFGKTFPTFPEFVTYIIEEDIVENPLDMHWMPV